jgi:hypothetical protein
VTSIKDINQRYLKIIISPIILLVLALSFSGLASSYPDRICYPLSTGPLCINSTSISGLTLSGLDFYNKSEIDEQQAAQNVTLSGYYNNLSNFSGSMVDGSYCVFNGSAIECNATGASGVTWIKFNSSGLLGGNITSSGSVDLNYSLLSLFYNDTVLIGLVNNVTAQNVTAWGFFNNVANSSFIINTANVSGWGFYYNLSNFSGSLEAGKWCIFNGSDIECNVTPVVDTDTDTFVTITNVSGWGFYYNEANLTNLLNDNYLAIGSDWVNLTGDVITGNITITQNLTVTNNITLGGNISGNSSSFLRSCLGATCIISWTEIANITSQNVTAWGFYNSVANSSFIINNVNVSGWGFYYAESNLTGLLNDNYLGIGSDWVNVTGDTMSGALLLPRLNVSGKSNASIFCLDSVCVDTWSEVNVTSFIINQVNVSGWGFYYSETNLTGLLDNNYLGIGSDWVNVTGDTMSGNLLTTGLNVSGRSNASVLCLDGVCVDTWSEVNVSGSADGTGGWTNTTVTTSTLLNVYAKGNITASTDGSSTSGPRVYGFSDLTSGEAARFQYGDEHNALQNAYGQDLTLYSYWGIVLEGGMQNYNSGFLPSNFTKTTDTGVLVVSHNFVGDDPGEGATQITTFGVQGDIGQTTNLTEWRKNTLGVISEVAAIDSNGGFTTNSNLSVNGGYISMPLTPKWKIGNYEANGNFSGVCYNGTNTYIGTSFNITSVGC